MYCCHVNVSIYCFHFVRVSFAFIEPNVEMDTDLSITISLRMIRPEPSLGMRPDSLPVYRSVQGPPGPTVILHPAPFSMLTPSLGAGTAPNTPNFNPGMLTPSLEAWTAPSTPNFNPGMLTPSLGAWTAPSTPYFNPSTQGHQGPIVELHPRLVLEPTGLNTRSQTAI